MDHRVSSLGSLLRDASHLNNALVHVRGTLYETAADSSMHSLGMTQGLGCVITEAVVSLHVGNLNTEERFVGIGDLLSTADDA